MGKSNSALTVRSEEQALRWFTLTHALGLLMFIGLMSAFFWYLYASEQEQQRQLLFRDVEWSQQTIRLRLTESKDLAAQLAPDLASDSNSSNTEVAIEPQSSLQAYFKKYPEINYVAMVDSNRKILWYLPARAEPLNTLRQPGADLEDSAGYAAYAEARDSRRVVFSQPFISATREVLVEMHVPDAASNGAKPTNSLVVALSLSRLITQSISTEIRSRYEISLIDQGGNRLVSTSPRTIFSDHFNYDLPLDPPGYGIRLRATLFDTKSQLFTSGLVSAILGLSVVVALGLMLLWQHTRRRLRAENERDRLFVLSLDLLCVTGPDGTLLKINPAFASRFPQATVKTRIADLVHADDKPAVEAALLGSVDIASFEAQTVGDALPKIHWLSWSMRRDPKSNPPQWYGVAHDVTQRREAEAALATEIAFRRAMEDSILTGMRAFDLNGKVTYVNRAFCSMVGLEESDLIGKSAPFPYWPENDHSAHTSNVELILQGRAPKSGIEVTVKRQDETLFDARMYVSPLINAAGEQTGWMTSMTDITEPKRVRQALSDAQDRFITVLGELEPAVSVIDKTGKLLFSNQAYQLLFGHSNAGHLRLAPSTSTSELFDETTGRWFDVRQRLIQWVDESFVTMMVATDVSRRVDAEKAQRAQGEKLQQTSRLVTMGEMASSLAHELNQPLSAIANYCMGLAARIRTRTASGAPIDTEETLDALKKASGQAERAGLVIKRIREFVKRSEPERRRCSVNELVSNALTLIEIEANRLNITVNAQIDDSFSSFWADPILIEQVLINLVKNGIESMRATSNDSKTLLLTVVKEQGHAKFCIRDWGSGIATDAESKLFQPFYTTKVEGMGMGLNICRSIVEAHQGRLYVERHEVGTSFIFTLPLVEELSELNPQIALEPHE
jgi:PAS domain S-box-containing protein